MAPNSSVEQFISKAASLKILLTPPSKSISETKDDLPLSLVDLRSRKNLKDGLGRMSKFYNSYLTETWKKEFE